jgi:cobalt-zinc-cadmium efflux system outer membrane protein
MEQMLSLQNELILAVRIQRQEGEISVLQANLAEVEVGRARARLLEARRAQLADVQALRNVLAYPPQVVFALSDAPPPAQLLAAHVDTLITAALQERSDVAALRAAVEQATQLAALARRTSIPNPTVGVLAEREDGGTQLGVSIGIPLPLWDRNRGAVEAARAEVQRAQHELAALEMQVRNEVAANTAAYALAVEQASIMEDAVLEPARENQRLLEIAYREGKEDLPTILLLRNQLLEAELDYLDAWLAARAALTDLAAAIGAPLQRTTGNER